MRQRIFTLQQIIKAGTERLEAAGIDEAALDAWYLLEYVTGISRAAYYGEPKRELGEEQARRYLECIERRKKKDSAAAYYRGTGIYGISVLCE